MRVWAKGCGQFMSLPFLRQRVLPHLPGGWLRLALAAAVVLSSAVVLIGPSRLLAQIEGDRGIAPVMNTGNIEVDDIDVATTGKTAAEARAAGWQDAYRQAWARLHGQTIGDGDLEGLVSAVVVGQEQIGPHRYIARLGVVFDRARSQALLAAQNGGPITHSPPTLMIPLLYSGGVGQIYEVQGAWQRTWAEFGTGASTIDYVRPSGAGGDSLLITAGQPGRRSRVWWRNILDQFGASNVVIAIARLERQWPDGPIQGSFTARYGPDNRWLASFTLTAPDEGGVPAMLNQALHQFDAIYTNAFQSGVLEPDASLSIDHPAVDPALASLIAEGQRQRSLEEQQIEAQARAGSALPLDAAPLLPNSPAPAAPAAAATDKAPRAAATAWTVQFASPDAHAIDEALAGVRAVPGVSAAATSSLAIGGTSVMRVNYAGGLQELAAALHERGWQVSVAGNILRIRR